MIANKTSQPPRPDSSYFVSGIPGAIHWRRAAALWDPPCATGTRQRHRRRPALPRQYSGWREGVLAPYARR